MANSLGSLRGDIARLRKATTRKISRIKQRHGAEISGSEFDPRRSPHAENRYNKTSLLSYKRQLENFVSRGNQFVGGSQGVPIPRAQWEKYKGLEQSFNSKINASFNRVAEIALPSNESIASRMARMTPTHRHMRGDIVNSPYDPVERESKQIRDQKALDKLIKQLQDRESGDWIKEKIREGREQFEAMADRIGSDELQDAVADLSDDQFAVLWFYSPFPRDVSFEYEYYKLINLAHERPYLKTVAEDAKKEYTQLLKWAKKLDI